MASSKVPEGLTLKKALVVFRHGARTPINTIPNMPQATYEEQICTVDMPETVFDYRVVDIQGGPRPYNVRDAAYTAVTLKGGAKSAQLTVLGQQGTYDLGASLKKEYIDHHKLLERGFNKDHVYFRSTNMNRTVKSLICVLSGLFGTESLQKSAPVEIPVAHESSEVLVPNPAYCSNLEIQHMLAKKHAELETGTLNDRLLIEKICGVDGTKQQLKWIELRDDLVARQAHDLEIPKELEPHMDMIDKNATTELYYALCGKTEKDNQVACMLSCGRAVHMFLEHLKMDTKDGSYRLYLYSCHDSTITALLGAFDIFDNKWPPFAADVRIELYEDEESNKFVKLVYLGKDVVSRGCKEIYSPYETFLKGISPFAVDEDSFVAACSSKEIRKNLQGNNEFTDDTSKITKAAGL